MCFKKIFTFFFVMIFLAGCGLKIHEEHYDMEKIEINTAKYADPFCSRLDYEKFFKDFFTSEISQEQIEKSFSCISSKIDQFKNIVRGERTDRLSKEELRNILNDSFFKKDSLKGTIEKILNPITFDRIMDFTRIVITTISLSQQEGPFHFENLCLKNQSTSLSHNEALDQDKSLNEEEGLRKTDIDIFIRFLKDISENFKQVQYATDSLYFEMITWFSQRTHQRDEVQNRVSAKQFISVLERGLARELPHWSRYLQTIQSSGGNRVSTPRPLRPGMPLASSSSRYKESKEFTRILNNLEKMTLLNDSFVDDSNSVYADIKFIVLNLYIVDMLMNIYDRNRSGRLEDQELEKAGCMFIPFIAIFSKPDLESSKEGWVNNIKKWLTEPVRIFDYVLYHQDIPDETVEYVSGSLMEQVHRALWGRTSLSRADLVQVIYVLFEHYFPFEYMYSHKPQTKPSPK